MNTFKRWLIIMLTCRLGFHKFMPQQVFAEGLKVRECSRCHSRIISTKHSNPYVYRLNAWDVARGLYDKLQDD